MVGVDWALFLTIAIIVPIAVIIAMAIMVQWFEGPYPKKKDDE